MCYGTWHKASYHVWDLDFIRDIDDDVCDRQIIHMVSNKHAAELYSVLLEWKPLQLPIYPAEVYVQRAHSYKAMAASSTAYLSS